MAKDLSITYETLFELLRIEKNREDLQKLDGTFFEDVLQYLKEKKAALDSKPQNDGTLTNLFEKDERETTRLELENIRKILRDLYDRREKKIVMTSINKAKTGVVLVNSANMLPEEKKLFNLISNDLCEFRNGVLGRIVRLQMPELPMTLSRELCDALETDTDTIEPGETGSAEAAPEITGGYDSGNGISNGQDSHFKTNSPDFSQEPSRAKELKTMPDSGSEGKNHKLVRFLERIDEIVGPDLQIYGPYAEGDEIHLPLELAMVLIEKNQAEGV